jgi:DNA repair protein RecO (recombination protein O)
MKTYKARGIVLRTMRYGENSMVVFLLTDALGRQNYMVQGVKGGKSRGNKAALFQPMFVLEYEGYESPKMQMHRMRDVRSAAPLCSLPFDVRKSTIALFMAEVLYRLVREAEPNSPLFGFVQDSVAALDAMQDGVANFHLWFLVMLSSHLGFYPGNEYVAGSWFDIKEGLFTPIMPSHRMMLERENAAVLAALMETRPEDLGALKLSRERRSAVLTAMLIYFGYHLDTINQVQSVQILREVF